MSFQQLFLKRQFHAIYEKTSVQFQQIVDEQQFISMCTQLRKAIRKLHVHSNKKWFGQTMTIYIDSKNKYGIQVIENEKGIITSLYVQPIHTYKSDRIYTKNVYTMPIAKEWFVFWGGPNVFENYHYTNRSQRYAYDLVILKNNRTYLNEGRQNTDYYAFNTEVTAPADGKIIAIESTIADNMPGQMNENQPLGNYVLIAHANGEYSVVAHLKQDTIRLQLNDEVKQGQVLGLCGNSGNSSEAHIHFHVMDEPNIQEANSLQIRFPTKQPVQGDFVRDSLIKTSKGDVITKVETTTFVYEVFQFISKLFLR